jgi:Tol biopolymer transport system component
MALSIGTKLGPYEILAAVGAGGMGEVYRARDAKLGRDVALKVLPEGFARDAERMARFQREAKVLASLNHTNIAAIYGLEDSTTTHALVMELAEGATLADRVKQGPLPIDDAMRIARQICDALEYAHERGIVHRDLKPANVKVTNDDAVKVLDFGLAKAMEGDAAAIDSSSSPTITRMATQAGVLLGTAAYMSPEQAKAKTVDRRADIWAFGCVFYEMLTGKMAFCGETVTDTLAAVIKEEPDWSRLPAATPTRVRVLLQRCLQKDPKQRLRDIGDARISLDEVLGGAPDPAPAGAAAISAPLWRGVLPWTIACAAVAAALALAFVHFREAQPNDSVLHLSVPLPGNAPAAFLALSPDGRRLVVLPISGDKSQLWVRSLDSPQLQPLPGTGFARAPFWSPDSKSIGFFLDGKLKTMPATGGPQQVLCEGAGAGAEGTWNRAGVILFSTSGVGNPIERVNASGGACTPVTKPEGGSSHAVPEFLPDGKHFVYVVRGGDEAGRGLYLAALDNPASRRLLPDESGAIFAPSTAGKAYGSLLFIRGSNLMAQPFNAETLQLSGDVFPVAADASFSVNRPQIAASVSASGILAYETNLGQANQLTWLDRSGKELGKVGNIEEERHVALSPDGRIAATERTNQGIWLYDMQRGGETRFSSPALLGYSPIWSPDGNLIAFDSGRGLYVKDASGGSEEKLLLENGNSNRASDWSRDGRYLIYTELDSKNQGDIWFLEDPLNKSGERKAVKFQGTDAVESQGQISPDGRWLAYASNESGEYEVYVRPFPSGPGRWEVSTGGIGREPRWRRDGKELFFLERLGGGVPSSRLMAVAVKSGAHGDFQAGAPQALFEFRAIGVVPQGNNFLYSPSADGQRFLALVQAPGAEPTVNVISNWEKAALGSK